MLPTAQKATIAELAARFNCLPEKILLVATNIGIEKLEKISVPDFIKKLEG